MQKVFEIVVDIQKKIPTPVFEVNTNDLKSIKLLITVTNGLSLLDLTDKTVLLSIRKPDDQVILQDCIVTEATNGKAEIVLENQAYLIPGTHTAEVMCYKDEEVVAVTGTFSYRSIKGIMNNQAVESKSEFTTITNMLKSVQDTIKDVRENGTGIDVQARSDIEKATALLAEMGYNISLFPRLSAETNDYNRFTRALNQIKEGGTLLLNNEEYDFAGLTLIWNKNISIRGTKRPLYDETKDTMSNGSIIKNGKLALQGKGYTVEKIGVATTLNNGIEANTGKASDIIIRDCVSRAVAHSYLFESYEELVEKITVENCISYKATHGFISKAEGIQFKNCKAFNHSSNGFGCISDNIPGVTKKGLAKNNTVVDSEAFNCGTGFTAYGNDNFSGSNENGIEANNIKFINCDAHGGNKGFAIGHASGAPTGQTYIQVKNIIIESCSALGQSGTCLELNLADGFTLNNFSTDSKVAIYGYGTNRLKNIKLGVIQSDKSDVTDFFDIKTLTVNSRTPNIEIGYNIFSTANTASTQITDFVGGKEGDVITVLIKDNFTSIENYSNIVLLNQTKISTNGSSVMFKKENGKWLEILAFRKPDNQFFQRKLDIDSTGLPTNNYGNFDIIPSGSDITTTNKITVPLSLPFYHNELTIVIRSIGGIFTYGGFDTNRFVQPTDLPLSVTFGNAVVTKWVWLNAISKYICTGWYLSKIS